MPWGAAKGWLVRRSRPRMELQRESPFTVDHGPTFSPGQYVPLIVDVPMPTLADGPGHRLDHAASAGFDIQRSLVAAHIGLDPAGVHRQHRQLRLAKPGDESPRQVIERRLAR